MTWFSCMIQFTLVTLVCVNCVSGAFNKYSNDPNEPEDFEELLMRLSGGVAATRADLPWMLFVADEPESIIVGYAAAISVKWAIAPTRPLNNILPTDLAVYSNSRTIIEYATGVRHIIREFKKHEFQMGLQNALVLMRLCPRLLDSSLINIPLNQNYPIGTNVQLCKYSQGAIAFLRAQKQIGEPCECADLAEWDENIMICLENHPTAFGQDNDYDIPVTTGSEILGFLLKPQLGNQYFEGESITNIGVYADWITVNIK